MAIHVVAVSGSPRAPSKSKTLAELMLTSFRRRNALTEMVDVSTLPAEALLAREPAVEIDKAIALVGTAQIVLAATPTYRATYTGALKAFFDLMPQGHLVGKICIPVQTGGSMAHFLTIEYGLRPLFTSLAGIPIDGLYVTDEQFSDGHPGEAVMNRIETLTGMALSLAQAS